MYINPYLFILARPPHQIIWNYSNHTQFELNIEYSKRLTQLIASPGLFDSKNPIDKDLLDAQLFTAEPITPIKWQWDELSKIFHIGTKNLPQEQTPQNVHEWASQYLAHCDDVLATPAPRQRSVAANQLLAILGIFFESDSRWLRESLSSVDLQPATLEHIVTQLQQPHAHQQRVRSGANATLLALTRAGFFDSDANRRLFTQAGFTDG